MNELQRQQYLEALGVESYMPRWVLPLAPAPQRCAAPLPVEAQEQEPAVAAPQVAEVVASQQRESLVSAIDVQPEVRQPEPKETSSPAPPETTAPTIQLLDEPAVEPAAPEAKVETVPDASEIQEVSFALGAWRVSDDLLIVDSRKVELALPVDALLVNILSALGYPRVALPKVEVVRWPREESAFLDRSETAARAMSQAWLSARLEAQPAKFLLLLGAEACHYLLPEAQAPLGQNPEESLDVQQGKAVRLEDLNCSAIVVPSLTDMLQQPGLKAQVWQALQPLRLQ